MYAARDRRGAQRLRTHSAEGYFPKAEKHGGGARPGAGPPSHGTKAAAIAQNIHLGGSPLAALNAGFAPDCSRSCDDNGAAGVNPERPFVAGMTLAGRDRKRAIRSLSLLVRLLHKSPGLAGPRLRIDQRSTREVLPFTVHLCHTCNWLNAGANPANGRNRKVGARRKHRREPAS